MILKTQLRLQGSKRREGAEPWEQVDCPRPLYFSTPKSERIGERSERELEVRGGVLRWRPVLSPFFPRAHRSENTKI